MLSTKGLMLTAFITAASLLQARSQTVTFPASLIGNGAKPGNQLIGPVRTVLTASYRNGILIGDVAVESYDTSQRKNERLTQRVSLEEHSGETLQTSQLESFNYDGVDKLPKEMRSLDANGKIITLVKYKYNSAGRLQEFSVYSGDGTLTDKVEFAFNNNTKVLDVTSTTYFGSRTVTSKWQWLYNDHKEWVSRTSFDRSGKPKDTTSFGYDKNGFLIKEVVCCDYNFYYSYKYKFDSHGNWIERVENYSQKGSDGSWDTKESMRTYRVISYFN